MKEIEMLQKKTHTRNEKPFHLIHNVHLTSINKSSTSSCTHFCSWTTNLCITRGQMKKNETANSAKPTTININKLFTLHWFKECGHRVFLVLLCDWRDAAGFSIQYYESETMCTLCTVTVTRILSAQSMSVRQRTNRNMFYSTIFFFLHFYFFVSLFAALRW